MCIGHDVLDIYNGLPFESQDNKQDIDIKVLQLLGAYCGGKTNETYSMNIQYKALQSNP